MVYRMLELRTGIHFTTEKIEASKAMCPSLSHSPNLAKKKKKDWNQHEWPGPALHPWDWFLKGPFFKLLQWKSYLENTSSAGQGAYTKAALWEAGQRWMDPVSSSTKRWSFMIILRVQRCGPFWHTWKCKIFLSCKHTNISLPSSATWQCTWELCDQQT